MALKGHGDPRWIVQDRQDGKNVNNWHWTESDFSGWTKDKLTELLGNMPIETDSISGKTNEVTTEAEVSVNTRKQKTLLFYELHVTIKWEATLFTIQPATLKSSSTSCKGTIVLPYISEENDDTDFEIKYTVDGETKEEDKAKDAVKQFMNPILKQKIPEMLNGLREVALGKTNMQLKQAATNKLDNLENTGVASPPPPVVTATPPPKPTTTPTPTPTTTTPTPTVPTPSATTTTVKKSSGIATTTVKVTEKFICRPVDLFQCFTELNRVKAYAGGDAQISADKGAKFSYFGGVVTGENIEVVYPTKLVQKWRFSSWPADHYSTVTIELEEKNGKTNLKLEQTSVPSEDRERTESGWQENFFKRIKGIFGYGPLY